MEERTKISFHFHPYDFENKGHVVVKEMGEGKKKRHICGISSGSGFDEHEERMTQKCVKSFMEQANSGDVLLYPDVHGIRSSEDIGILKEAKILENPTQDWWTDYALYDKEDGIGTNKVETIDTLWKQLNGLPPYTRPKQKGFSIEGYIPKDGIIGGEVDQMGNVSKRIIDEVLLDGVVLVPRPAYKDSIATAVYKALNELSPVFENNLRKSIQNELQNRMRESEIKDSYYKKKWDIQDALESQIEKIMRRVNDPRKAEQLHVLLQEYSDLLINLVMNSESLFIEDEENVDNIVNSPYGVVKDRGNPKIELFQNLLAQLKSVQKSINQRSL
jgi:hypothetical protein